MLLGFVGFYNLDHYQPTIEQRVDIKYYFQYRQINIEEIQQKHNLIFSLPQIIKIIAKYQIEKLFGDLTSDEIFDWQQESQQNKQHIHKYFINKYSSEQKLMQIPIIENTLRADHNNYDYRNRNNSDNVSLSNSVISKIQNPSSNMAKRAANKGDLNNQSILASSAQKDGGIGKLQNVLGALSNSQQQDSSSINLENGGNGGLNQGHQTGSYSNLLGTKGLRPILNPNNDIQAPSKCEKISRKIFLSKIDLMTDFIQTLVNIENMQVKNLSAIGQPKLFRNSTLENLFVVDDRIKENELSLREGSEKQKILLSDFQEQNYYRFLKLNAESMFLPQWRIIQNGLNHIASSHEYCAQFLVSGGIDVCQILQKDYLQAYSELQIKKNQQKTEMIQAQNYLTTTRQECQILEDLIKSDVESYTNLKKRHNDPSSIIKLELKIKLAGANLSSVQVRLRDSRDQHMECQQKIYDLNQEILAFQYKWHESLLHLIRSTLRSILSGYQILLSDEKKVVKELVNFEVYQQREKVLLAASTGKENMMGNSSRKIELRRINSVKLHDFDDDGLDMKYNEDFDDLNNGNSEENSQTRPVERTIMKKGTSTMRHSVLFKIDEVENAQLNDSHSGIAVALPNQSNYNLTHPVGYLEYESDVSLLYMKKHETLQNLFIDLHKYYSEVSYIIIDISKSYEAYSFEIATNILYKTTLKQIVLKSTLIKNLTENIHLGIGKLQFYQKDLAQILQKREEQAQILKDLIEKDQTKYQDNFSAQFQILTQLITAFQKEIESFGQKSNSLNPGGSANKYFPLSEPDKAKLFTQQQNYSQNANQIYREIQDIFRQCKQMERDHHHQILQLKKNIILDFANFTQERNQFFQQIIKAIDDRLNQSFQEESICEDYLNQNYEDQFFNQNNNSQEFEDASFLNFSQINDNTNNNQYPHQTTPLNGSLNLNNNTQNQIPNIGATKDQFGSQNNGHGINNQSQIVNQQLGFDEEDFKDNLPVFKDSQFIFDSGAYILSKLLRVFWEQWSQSDFFMNFVNKFLYLTFNQKLSHSLDQILITKVKV